MYLFYVIIFRILIQVFLTLTHKKLRKLWEGGLYYTFSFDAPNFYDADYSFPEISISHHSIKKPKDPPITCQSAKKNVSYLVHQRKKPQQPTTFLSRQNLLKLIGFHPLIIIFLVAPL
jgi:hypothetical protein